MNQLGAYLIYEYCYFISTTLLIAYVPVVTLQSQYGTDKIRQIGLYSFNGITYTK